MVEMGNMHTLVPVRRNPCKVCMNDEQEHVVRLVSDGVISNLHAAERMGVGIQTWYNHLKFCVRNAVESAIAPNVDEISKKVIDNVFELVGQVERTKELTKKVYDALREKGEELDPKQLQSYVMLEKQLSNTIELYSKITGDLKNSAVINVTNTKIEFNDFRSKVLSTICVSCKKKIAELGEESVEVVDGRTDEEIEEDIVMGVGEMVDRQMGVSIDEVVSKGE